jgi:hypothetical protein
MRWTLGILATALFVGCTSSIYQHPIVTPEPGTPAWWLRITFRPTERAIRGVAVSELDRSWRFATELRKELIPHDLLFEGGIDTMSENKLVFPCRRFRC